jgi:hypothetical protein
MSLIDMSVLSQPNHPFRLAAMVAAGSIAAWIVVMALISVRYIVEDQRDSAVNRVLGTSAEPGANIEAPEGLVIVTPVDTAAEFEELAGFAPFLPDELPASSVPEPNFAVTPPDEYGFRMGRVSYSAREGWSAYGITGPVVVIAQGKGEAGEGVDGALKLIKGGTRSLASTFACGDLVLDVQLYFGPDPQANEEIVTPHMRDVAVRFLDGIREQCGQ